MAILSKIEIGHAIIYRLAIPSSGLGIMRMGHAPRRGHGSNGQMGSGRIESPIILLYDWNI